MQNLDDQLPINRNSAMPKPRVVPAGEPETDTGGDRGDMEDNLAHRDPTSSVFGAIEE
jgi:hypothetical protein